MKIALSLFTISGALTLLQLKRLADMRAVMLFCLACKVCTLVNAIRAAMERREARKEWDKRTETFFVQSGFSFAEVSLHLTVRLVTEANRSTTSFMLATKVLSPACEQKLIGAASFASSA
mmetsp:Transcript_30275/g.75654  ORF Transcript_30275/g.75654 Transcript_30275/m.75654 type:complete len:120 (+) Transcript_30275:681-1040(+)